ncbi:uncharacterized PE-PGRS family protein PE_PGRS20-like, partial [Schistocerca nitens]|uniref:uncharacterized PE-PGRS family protein PE_PGRS20-like n=1 Tax=Schistocerca nitens TaxID=7011 RepID=UPI002117FDF9
MSRAFARGVRVSLRYAQCGNRGSVGTEKQASKQARKEGRKEGRTRAAAFGAVCGWRLWWQRPGQAAVYGGVRGGQGRRRWWPGRRRGEAAPTVACGTAKTGRTADVGEAPRTQTHGRKERTNAREQMEGANVEMRAGGGVCGHVVGRRAGAGGQRRGDCLRARPLARVSFVFVFVFPSFGRLGASEAVRGSGNACLAAGTASKCGWMGGHSTAPVPKEATLAAGPPRMRPAGAVTSSGVWWCAGRTGAAAVVAWEEARRGGADGGVWYGENGTDGGCWRGAAHADTWKEGTNERKGTNGGGECGDAGRRWSEAVRGSGNACLAAGTASKCGWMGGHSTAPVPKEATLAAGPPRMRPAGAVTSSGVWWCAGRTGAAAVVAWEEARRGGADGGVWYGENGTDGGCWRGAAHADTWKEGTNERKGTNGGGECGDAGRRWSEAVRGSGNACLAAGTASKCGWMGGHSTAPVPKEATLAAGPPRMRPAGAV